MEKKYFFLLRTWLCAGAVLGLADAELGRQLGPQQQRLGRVQGLQGRKIFNIYHKNIFCSLSVRTCELLCCWGWVWRELRVWRLRPTSLRGAAEEEADTRHWLSTEAVWCTLSSVLELSRWLSI